ncbi:MAG: hypothetical protein GY953_11755, partial [bacterium]|nr:hypothetical protein [bacterium]
CAIPLIGVLEAKRDFAAAAFEARLLRFLKWFGLVERRELDHGEREYRKTKLFDRMLSFDIKVPIVGVVSQGWWKFGKEA